MQCVVIGLQQLRMQTLELTFPLNSVHTQWTTAEWHQLIRSCETDPQISLLVCSNAEYGLFVFLVNSVVKLNGAK